MIYTMIIKLGAVVTVVLEEGPRLNLIRKGSKIIEAGLERLAGRAERVL
jgi:hypothetical protein